MRKPKFMIIMEALWQGHEIDFHGYKMVMVDAEDGTPTCAFKAHSSERGEILLGTHLTLDGFITECERMSDDYVVGVSADVALNKAMNRGPRRKDPLRTRDASERAWSLTLRKPGEDADLPAPASPVGHIPGAIIHPDVQTSHHPTLAELYAHGDITPRAAADTIISALRDAVIGDDAEVPARYDESKIEIRFAIEGGRQIVVTCYPSGKATTGGPECAERAVTRKILGEIGFKVGC